SHRLPAPCSTRDCANSEPPDEPPPVMMSTPYPASRSVLANPADTTVAPRLRCAMFLCPCRYQLRLRPALASGSNRCCGWEPPQIRLQGSRQVVRAPAPPLPALPRPLPAGAAAADPYTPLLSAKSRRNTGQIGLHSRYTRPTAN